MDYFVVIVEPAGVRIGFEGQEASAVFVAGCSVVFEIDEFFGFADDFYFAA